VLEKLAVAMSVMFLCTFVHALFMIVGHQALEWRLNHRRRKIGLFSRSILIWLVIMWMCIGIGVEATIWALLYLFSPAITVLSDFQTAFYFSMVTYTTLGYGDIVLTGDWRTLSSVQAANGVIIFGWTTALIFYFIQRIFKAENPS